MRLERGAGADEVGNHETINGGDNAETLAAGLNNETVHGGASNDVIIGDAVLGRNIIVNGGFEIHPAYNQGDYGFYRSIEGWNRWGRNNIEVEDESRDATDSHTGSVVELDADGNSGIYQRIGRLERGELYQVSVDYSALPGTVAATNTIEIWFGGKLLDTIEADGTTLTNLDFQTFTYTVEATSNGNTWIGLRAVGTDDYYGGIIDNVEVRSVSQTTDASAGGNDFLDGGEGDDEIFGRGGNDVIEGGAGKDMIDGGAGTDTVVFNNAGGAVQVNLHAGSGSGSEAQGDRFANVENVLGSAHDDTIKGDEGGNRLNGNAGNDAIDGGAGRDVLIGGSGADAIDGGEGDLDVVDFGASHRGVDVNLQTGVGRGAHAEGDTYTNVEGVNGSYHNDIITGDDNDNRLYGDLGDDIINGGGGNDVLRGGTGADALDGGAGTQDVADLSKAIGAVNVNLATGIGSGSSAEGDTYVNIENVLGSDFDDVITGDNADNRLIGNDGDDTIIGGAGKDVLIGGLGADALDGGAGRADIASYKDADAAVSLSLSSGGTAGEAAGDTFANVEVVYGSDFGDTIEGDNGRNRLVGFDGDDFLDGAGSHDTLIGGLGNDTLTGGAGIDSFLFEAAFGNDTITDFEAGTGLTDRLWFKGLGLTQGDLNIQQAGTDTLITAESYGTVLLENFTATDLVADDFIF